MKNNLIPRKLLFGNPERSGPQLSPDGTMLAYLAPFNNVLNIWVGNLDEQNFRPVTSNNSRGIGTYFWAQDNQRILYLQDIGGDENWHLHSVNIYTGETDDLTPFDNVQVKLAEHDMHFPDDVILAINLDNPALHDIYHLDIKTKRLKKIALNPGNIIGWEVDTALKVRGAFTTGKEGGYNFMVRDAEHSEWRTLIEWDAEDSQSIALETFTEDNQHIYIRDPRGSNVSRLVKININTGETEEIFSDPECDINFVMTHPETYEIQLLSITRERNEIYILDPDIVEAVTAISQLNPGDYVIYDRDNADRKWLVGFTEDNAPSSFYLYDRDKKEGKLLFYNTPGLLNYELARMEAFSIKSRDGLTLNGYITFPPGKGRENLPLVLNVHGGPWQRDTWGFHPESQWLANRGYICLQVNYRGSAGYGKEFLNAGNKEWGRKMQNDLVDAVNWAVAMGFADPGKIAVYGISYGGYAALAGAAFTPELFCCAVDVVGPSNLITMIRNIPPYWQAHLDNLKKRVGDPDTEAEFLKSRSPLFYVDQIKIPVLIAQGINDPRVKKSEAEQIVAAMQQKNIYYEYLLFPDEGHGIAKPENRMRFYAAAEKFLSRYLGGDYEEEALGIIRKAGLNSGIFD